MVNNNIIDNFTRLFIYDSTNTSGIRYKSIKESQSFKVIQKLKKELKFKDELNNLEILGNVDNFLIEECDTSSSFEELLCLRCRVSDLIRISFLTLLKKLSKNQTVNNNLSNLKIDLYPFLLNDSGSKYQISVISKFGDLSSKRENILLNMENLKSLNENYNLPFSFEIISSYDKSFLYKLSNWTYLKVKSNSNLKEALREYGVDFYSNWVLISKYSPKTLQIACDFLGIKDQDNELYFLHERYMEKYPLAKKTHKAKFKTIFGWKPNNEFLLSLSPTKDFINEQLKNISESSSVVNKNQSVWDLYAKGVTHKELVKRNYLNLKQIAEILREYKRKKYENIAPNNYYEEYEIDPIKKIEIEEGIQTLKIANKITNNLISSNAVNYLKRKIENQSKLFDLNPDKKKAWELYSEGLSQREIAKKCKKGQTWVSNLIQEKSLSRQVAQEILPSIRSQFRDIVKRKKKIKIIANDINTSELIKKIAFFEKKISRIEKDPTILDSKIEQISEFFLSKQENSSTNYLQTIVKAALTK